MERALKMVFLNELGKLVTLTLSNVKAAATPAEVTALMQAIITNNIFSTTGGNLVTIKAASIVTTDTENVTVA